MLRTEAAAIVDFALADVLFTLRCQVSARAASRGRRRWSDRRPKTRPRFC
jgi:hypothetical protein